MSRKDKFIAVRVDGTEYRLNKAAAQSTELLDLVIDFDEKSDVREQLKLVYKVLDLLIDGGSDYVKAKLKKDGFTPMNDLLELFPKLMDAIQAGDIKAKNS